jgi:hypothetical protein
LKTIIKILISLAILNAAAQWGMASWRHYEFEDSARNLVLFGSGTDTTQLHAQILELAEQYELDVLPEDIEVQRNGARTWAEVAYEQPVELFPNYEYPLDFSFSVEAFAVAGLTR